MDHDLNMTIHQLPVQERFELARTLLWDLIRNNELEGPTDYYARGAWLLLEHGPRGDWKLKDGA